MTDKPEGGLAADLAFLRERLAQGDACLRAGNARGAIVWYDSALAAHPRGGEAPELRETCHALWHNKAVAHQQLREFVEAKEAELHAQRLSAR
ncbi:MAG: hypothetical protein J0M16_05270 [Gammaproteobacteria bacterium]|nr:hypothetical protein [Gammaproteobacteria bacterium]